MLLSIIIPAYNAEQYISDCLDSIIRNVKHEYEIIVINDGSTDRTGELCDKYARANENIKVIHQSNKGPSYARNIGIANASGEYVWFVDADDTVPVTCNRLISYVKESANADMIIGDVCFYDKNNKLTRYLRTDTEGYVSIDDLLDLMTGIKKEQYMYYVWNKIYKLKLIKKNSIYFKIDLRLGEDFLFNCSYYSICKNICIVSECMYNYYKRDEKSLTGMFNENELERRRRMDAGFIDLLNGCNNKFDKNRRKYGIDIGENAFKGMMSINKKTCRLGLFAKVKFVRGFLYSEYREYLIMYLTEQCSKPWNRMLLYTILLRFGAGAVVLILLKNIKQKRR